MKACPNCQSAYEDWIEFCFNDGVPLVPIEPKAAAPQKPASKPAAPPSSLFDAPAPRSVSGADLPDPGNLGRFGVARSAFDAPEPPRAPVVVPPAPEQLPAPTAIAAPLSAADVPNF